MIEVYPGLFVGSQDDVAAAAEKSFYIIHAAKEPWHRMALGYTERAAPKDHPEYLVAKRSMEMMLNLVDAPDPAYIPMALIEQASAAITIMLSHDKSVLIHCNQGFSRAPGIALLYLRQHDAGYTNLSYDEAAELFRETYPAYAPGKGIEGYLRAHWGDDIDLPQTAA